MKKYVAGFLFSSEGTYVALVRKNQPKWQEGKLNGIGGKIEEGETPLQAMTREFKEEAGLEITDWKPFCVLKGNDDSYVQNGTQFEVHFFSCFDDQVFDVKTMEKEDVRFYVTESVLGENKHVPNLKWLIPMALEKTLTSEVVEKINL